MVGEIRSKKDSKNEEVKKMKKVFGVMCALTFLLCMASSSAAFLMDFEEGVGNDGTQIIGVPGVTFTTSGGETWTYGDANTGGYNVTSVNTGNVWGTGRYNMYDSVFAWLGISGNWGRIDFDDQTGTWFQVGVSSASAFTLEAYDASDNLLDSAYLASANTQWEGYTDMTFLRVDAPAGSYIAYVLLSDAGNYWCADNMSGDMAGGIPDPSMVFLLGSACLIGFARLRRKFKG